MNLYLIDGNSYVYRAFFAIRGLTDSLGRPTNAIFGFTTMLIKILESKKPDAIAVCFDSPQPTERHIIFEKYKAHRPQTPDELRAQLPHIKRIIDAFRIKTFMVPGYEADDIIATIAERASEKGANVYIVTADKDMLQLIHGTVRVYDPMKDAVLDENYVLERFGVPPSRVIEYMALVGDATDNIPGVKGIGEKTAKELLSRFSSLEELAANPQRIEKERIRRLIVENQDIMMLSRELARINRTVPIEVNIDEFRIKEPDWYALLGLFKEFEFTSLLRLIPGAPPPERHYETITSEQRLIAITKTLGRGFAFNIEATSPEPMNATFLGIALCAEKGSAGYVPVAHNNIRQIERDVVISALKPYLEDEGIEKTGHNIKYDAIVLKKDCGINLRGRLYDTMIASYLLNPLRADHSLENIALEHLGLKKKTFLEVTGKRRFADIPIEEASGYACDNAELSLELREILFEKLKNEALERLYYEIEMPLIGVLADMEEAGIKIDTQVLASLSRALDSELESLKQRIYFLAGMEFNINSPKQLGKVLFETLGLRPGRKKKTGYSTEMAVLEELSKEHELPREVLNWRTLAKLKGTYVDSLPLLVNPRTGRLHSSFNQTATATGRLSSSEPNLQNIPVRGNWGFKIRQAFVAEKDNLIITADYSQIELRILAHISGDNALKEYFLKDIDIHSATAAEIFGISAKDVTSDMRRIAKTVNFGIVYGITPFGLSETLGISKEEAGRYISQYFERHPQVKAYIKNTIAEAELRGYVRTLSGRLRPVPELRSKDPSVRQLGQRLAVNSPIQGTAADIIKMAMINIHRRLKADSLGAKMILQVHDELIFECPENERDLTMEIVKKEMESVKVPTVDGWTAFSVPLKVEMGSGRNWAEAAH